MQVHAKYDADDEDHVEMLKILWVATFGESGFTPVSQAWKALGFQTDDPSRDFRGGGVWSLKQMVYFARRYPKNYSQVVQQSREYLWAVSSLNVTYIILAYFSLSTKSPLPDLIVADSRRQKNFMRLYAKDPAFLDEVYVQLCLYCHKKWLKHSENPSITLLDFGTVLKWVGELLHELMKIEFANTTEFKASAAHYIQ